MRAALLLAVLLALAGGCTPRVQGLGPTLGPPRLEAAALVSVDGARLPLSVWPASRPTAVILALHGFNDYRKSFEAAAGYWAGLGIVTYAFDQRGFGESTEPGIWGGRAAMVQDVRAAAAVLRQRHPGLPLYLLGESMGGAVALAALAGPSPPVDGLILSAPAVWGARAMNPFYRAGLWLWAHLAPAATVTGRGLDRLASDNVPMLRGLAKDPLVIKQTRVDAVYGLTRLMGDGFRAAPGVDLPVLLLFGARDEIVPASAVSEMVEAMAAKPRIAVYPDGWHMLLRDCQAPVVWRDVAAWVADPASPLPSGAEVVDAEAVKTTDRGPVAETCPDS